MSGILTTLCGGLVLIAGWQYRQRLAGIMGLLMIKRFAKDHPVVVALCQAS